MSTEPQATSTETATPPLDEVMLAMDVVDTLRHRQVLVERELNAEQRDQRLVEQLRAIYRGQGIEVSDEVLREGLKALKEERFAYRPPADNLSVRLAKWYVSRDRWLGPTLKIALLAISLILAYVILVSRPAAQRVARLPRELEQQREAIVELSATPEPKQLAERLGAEGRRALQSGNVAAAQQSLQELQELEQALQLEYQLRIVSRPFERSGVIRTPDINPNATNYYIIVEPVGPAGNILQVPVRSEEDGLTRQVRRWGMRVDREVYEQIAADKSDDGIIQENLFGVKRRGYLSPEYIFPTTGDSITSW